MVGQEHILRLPLQKETIKIINYVRKKQYLYINVCFVNSHLSPSETLSFAYSFEVEH